MNRTAFMAVFAAALCFCSALAVAYFTHLSRQAYMELSSSQKAMDALDVQWSQLQIEESTFSEHGRVDRTARDQLGMSFPALDGTVMIVRSRRGGD
jgi:cell division protein FtsL